MQKKINPITDPVIKINNETKIRKKKLRVLKKNSFVFLEKFYTNFSSKKLYKKFFNKNNQELKNFHHDISIAGRIINFRIMGKASFVTIQDIEGSFQLYITSNKISSEEYEKNFKKWDIGDIIGVTGKIFRTKTGTLSIFCHKIQLLTKSLRSLPNKFHGIKNQEIRYRKRYLDLITSEKSRNIFNMRSKIIFEIRNFMIKNKFLEVETPILQTIPGGASARPFVTYHNTLNLDMYLRVSPELYLKKLIVGGFKKIFELNKNFRNEGISSFHNPEFTMMELYIAYSKYEDLIKLLQDLFYTLSKKILKSSILHYKNNKFDLKKPFTILTMKEAILKYHPKIHPADLNNNKKLYTLASKYGIKIDNNRKIGYLLTKIFEKTVESNLIQPTCITEYPVEVSPLARRNKENREIVDRFEFFISGFEIANGFSELNDAEDQLNRFLQQDKNKKYDRDYIEALEYGLPPTSGLGIGIDRIVMLFTNSKSIRDVILFPFYRPV